MLSSTALRPLSPATTPAYSATPTATTSAVAWRRAVVVRVLRDYGSIPKRESFSSSRSILDEFFKTEKPLVQRTKDQITDYCTTLEGDECCSCWDAYFELNKLEQELPQEEIARMVKESRSDPRYLISSIHHRSDLRKKIVEKAHSSVPSNSPGQKRENEKVSSAGKYRISKMGSTNLVRNGSTSFLSWEVQTYHD